jgi:hypothetical protein
LRRFFAALNRAGFLITKEKTMHFHIDRQPPSTEEMVQRLIVRNALVGARAGIETIGPHASCIQCRTRRERSLKHCHLPAEPKPRHPSPRDTDEYVPEMAARIDNDLNLTEGARRCARKIRAYTHRKNPEGREAEITVTYLEKALGRCRRSVQRYLRQLEHEGYIDVLVVPSDKTRMCIGLLVRVLDPLLPRHRRKKRPVKAGNPAATTESQIYSSRFKKKPIRRALWAFFCCEGVYRSYMKTLPPPPPFPSIVFPSASSLH